MRLLTHIVSPEQEGWPLRRLLRQELRISGSFLSRLKWRPGAILLNGQPATVAAVLHTGDVVTADVSDLPGDNPHIRPVDYPLDILWEDEDLLVLNKPAGIAIHPAALTEETVTVAGAVCHYLGQGSFHCVNRLDRGTTGVMVVAKTGYVHRLCMEQLHSGDFRRTYLAVCSGVPSPAAGSIDLPIGREPDSLLRRRGLTLEEAASGVMTVESVMLMATAALSRSEISFLPCFTCFMVLYVPFIPCYTFRCLRMLVAVPRPQSTKPSSTKPPTM